jgi:hypothetical protein
MIAPLHRSYIKEHGDLAAVPSGMHAVVPAAPDPGLPRGAIFALRNRNRSVNLNQQNRLHPYYLVYVSSDRSQRVVADHTEPKRLPDLIRAACKGVNEPVPEAYRPFNRQTDDGRKMQVYSELLAAAIRSIVDRKAEKDIDSLFSGPKTTALLDNVAGIDDFELIAFLVIQPS